MIVGTYFDGKTSVANRVEVQFGATSLRVAGLERPLEAQYADLKVSEPLGNTARNIEFPDGARLNLPNIPELDRLSSRGPFYWAHFLERQWRYALASVLMIICVSWIMIIPFSAIASSPG